MDNQELPTEEIKEKTEGQIMEPSKPNAIDLDQLKVAYVVGLSEEGEFIFQLFGKDKGLIELLGINTHASYRIKKLYDETQLKDDKIVSSLVQGINIINQKLDALMSGLAGQPKRPDNKL